MAKIDINISSDVIVKLLDVIEKGVGNLLKPWQIRRIGEAQIEIDNKVAAAKRLYEFKDNLLASLEDNVNERCSIEKHNICAIIAQAANELQEIENIDKTPVPFDWAARFFDYAKYVTEDEVRVIWARLLAEEIKKTGTYSKRTLTVLHNMEKEELISFSQMCSFVISDILPFEVFENESRSSAYMDVHKIQAMLDCGLLDTDSCEVTFASTKELEGHSLKYLFDRQVSFSISGYSLTDAGWQLSKIIPCKKNTDYALMYKKILEEETKANVDVIFKE